VLEEPAAPLAIFDELALSNFDAVLVPDAKTKEPACHPTGKMSLPRTDLHFLSELAALVALVGPLVAEELDDRVALLK
jgi:hypothetical protein